MNIYWSACCAAAISVHVVFIGLSFTAVQQQSLYTWYLLVCLLLLYSSDLCTRGIYWSVFYCCTAAISVHVVFIGLSFTAVQQRSLYMWYLLVCLLLLYSSDLCTCGIYWSVFYCWTAAISVHVVFIGLLFIAVQKRSLYMWYLLVCFLLLYRSDLCTCGIYWFAFYCCTAAISVHVVFIGLLFIAVQQRSLYMWYLLVCFLLLYRSDLCTCGIY